MKVLYAARVARFDSFSATCSFARMVTKWASDGGRRFHRFMCYARSSLDVHFAGRVGNGAGSVEPRLYIDADVA
eukprot:2571884-Lingulodinium_polyedra.AAC.1